MTAEEAALRRTIVATAQAMSRSGLSPGRSGNVSARWQGGMLITPSGVAYETLTVDDIVAVDSQGRPARHRYMPSSESQMHQAIYARRADASAIVHSHSKFATVLACAHRPIPAFHYMVAIAGGMSIPLVPYATFGTEELAEHAANGLAAVNACLLANHGQIALGPTPVAALELAQEIEVMAEQYHHVLLQGQPHILDDAEMRRVIARFASYGAKAQSG
jgi:L-fuculose-phosphate aldolase